MLNLDYRKVEQRACAIAGQSGDPHRERASELFGVPEDRVTPEQRKAGKLDNFRRMYDSKGLLK